MTGVPDDIQHQNNIDQKTSPIGYTVMGCCWPMYNVTGTYIQTMSQRMLEHTTESIPETIQYLKQILDMKKTKVSIFYIFKEFLQNFWVLNKLTYPSHSPHVETVCIIVSSYSCLPVWLSGDYHCPSPGVLVLDDMPFHKCLYAFLRTVICPPVNLPPFMCWTYLVNIEIHLFLLIIFCI